MVLPSAAKWLVIWALCNLATAVLLVALWLVVWALSPPIAADGAVAIARDRMEERYMRAAYRKENATDCTADGYPEGKFRANDAFEVICSIVGNSQLLARTTFIFGRDGLAGHEDWQLDGMDE